METGKEQVHVGVQPNPLNGAPLPVKTFWQAVQGLKETRYSKDEQKLFDLELQLFNIALERGTINHKSGERTVEPCVDIREDKQDILYGLRIMPVGKTGAEKQTVITYKKPGQRNAEPLVALLNGTVKTDLEIDYRDAHDLVASLGVFCQAFNKHFAEKDRQDAWNKSERQREKRAKVNTLLRRGRTVIGGAALVGGIGYGVYMAVNADPDQSFDDKNISLKNGAVFKPGETGTPAFSTELYEGKIINIKDVPKVGGTVGATSSGTYVYNDGLRLLTVARSNENKNVEVCAIAPMDASAPAGAKVYAYTNIPGFTKESGLQNMTVSFDAKGQTVKACVNDWVPGLLKQSVVFDVK